MRMTRIVDQCGHVPGHIIGLPRTFFGSGIRVTTIVTIIIIMIQIGIVVVGGDMVGIGMIQRDERSGCGIIIIIIMMVVIVILDGWCWWLRR